ncbi:MAG TPA: GAF and ANTAR domain-containing protein [Jatrophihabitans sp.]
MTETTPDSDPGEPTESPSESEIAADLRDSLAALATLSAVQLDLTGLLTRVAECAVQAIPGADGAGLTLLEKGHADVMVASASFVEAIDAIQYSLGEGPCITAAAEGRTIRSGSLGGDTAWPRFGPRIGRLGVHSVLSLPLITADVVVGAMNVYAHSKNAFDEDAARVGELFAVPAAIAVQNAQVLAQTKRLATQLQTALISRSVIDQAMGIVMSRTGCTSDDAMGRLRERSQAENIKLSTLAHSIVEDAVRRARTRHGGSEEA